MEEYEPGLESPIDLHVRLRDDGDGGTLKKEPIRLDIIGGVGAGDACTPLSIPPASGECRVDVVASSAPRRCLES